MILLFQESINTQFRTVPYIYMKNGSSYNASVKSEQLKKLSATILEKDFAHFEIPHG